MKNCVYAVVLLLLVGLTGCQQGNKNVLDPDNALPKKQYIVASGFTINYEAPKDGAAILVEKTIYRIVSSGRTIKTTEKIIQTKSLKKEERFLKLSGGITGREYDTMFVLYFIPSEKIETPANKPAK